MGGAKVLQENTIQFSLPVNGFSVMANRCKFNLSF